VVEIGKLRRHDIDRSSNAKYGNRPRATLGLVEAIRAAFTAIVAPGAGALHGHLDAAALTIAAAVDSSVSVHTELERLDELAESLQATNASELAIELFGGVDYDPVRHFGGNRLNYYDVENSLLNRVLDRRVGIPISLAVLLIEVGRRRGIELHGVGMPGHFLVRSSAGYIDTFHGGVLLNEAGCEQLYRGLAGPGATLPADALQVTPPASIVKRMLFNLSAIGSTQQQRRTLRATRSLLAAFPDATHRDHIQHAYAAAEIGQFGEAATAAESAIETLPEQLRGKLELQIDAWRARLN